MKVNDIILYGELKVPMKVLAVAPVEWDDKVFVEPHTGVVLEDKTRTSGWRWAHISNITTT